MRPMIADHACRRALAAWGPADPGRVLARFGPNLRARIESAPMPAADPLNALRLQHAAEARPDPAHVHPTWWLRALQDESPAVRSLVAAHAPPVVATALHKALADEENPAQPGRPPHPEALRWVLSLWAERLVGGEPVRDDDPPVVAALARLDRRGLQRLISCIGVAKRAYAPSAFGTADEPPPRPLRPRDRARFDHFLERWGKPDRLLARVARQDRAASPALPWLGLVTIGRLLTIVEPQRSRWALQHLPYNVAKFTRSKMTLKHPLVSREALVAWEARTLAHAWARLHAEGRLPAAPGGPA